MCHTKCFHALQILSRECCNVIYSIYTLVTEDLGGTKHFVHLCCYSYCCIVLQF